MTRVPGRSMLGLPMPDLLMPGQLMPGVLKLGPSMFGLLMLGVLTLGVSGCGGDERSAVSTSGLSGEALAGALERLAESADDASERAAWASGDIGFQPDSPFESIELMALLGDSGDGPVSFWYRLDRVALPVAGGAKDGADDATESFRATALISASGLQMAEDAVESRQLLERATLGLATHDERGIHVRDVDLTLDIAPDVNAPCGGSYRLEDGLGLLLEFTRDTCGSITRGGDLHIATAGLSRVVGEVRLRGRTRAVSGRGWVRQLRGSRPLIADGPIVFDRLLLTLDGVGRLDALRNKRRSGRGPVRTTARFDDTQGVDVAMEWVDVADQGGLAWRLREPARGIDVVLEPVVAAGPASARVASSPRDPLQRDPVWRGAIRASGTHEGSGFVEISLPEPIVAGVSE